MNALEQMNNAMRYVENNLTGELDDREVARIARCSEYHFQRMFSFLAGMPFSEYVRRRKLALAASLLKNSDEKIHRSCFVPGIPVSGCFFQGLPEHARGSALAGEKN